MLKYFWEGIFQKCVSRKVKEGRRDTHVREFVVHNEVDIGDVQATGGDIGGNKHQRLAITESLQGALASGLCNVTVQRLQVDASTIRVQGHKSDFTIM